MRVDVAVPRLGRGHGRCGHRRAFGGIDYLVNNAAIFGGMKLDLSADGRLGVPGTGSWPSTAGRSTAPGPATRRWERGGGAIVNQSSTAAYLYAGFYGLAKAGVNSLTQQLAHELGA
jgi:3-oxoacyl-[acyl-carrier protein] reductase